MSVRETIDKNPALAIGVSMGVMLVAALLSLWTLGIFSRGPVAAEEGEVFISEDYATYRPGTFKERFENGPNGEPKAIAYVVKVGADEPVVHYFERLAPKALEAINKLPQHDSAASIDRTVIQNRGAEVKRPGDEKWVPASSPQGDAITMPPDVEGDVTMVTP